MTRKGKGRRRVARLTEYWSLRFCVVLLRLMPLAVAMRVAAAVAAAYIALDRKRRRIGLVNLAIAFPALEEAKRVRILRASFANLGRTIAECAHLQRLSTANIGDVVFFEDQVSWRRLLAKLDRTGAMIVTGHFGNWELFHYAHALLGYPVHLVHRKVKNPLVDQFLKDMRTRSGTVLHAKNAAARDVVRALQQRQIVVIPLDQNASGKMGVFVDFFGRRASTNSGLARLALMTRMPVCPAFLVREGSSHRHRIVVCPLVEPVAAEDKDTAVRETTQRYARVIQEMIAKHPEQWLWTHKRWRTRPPGEESIY